MKPGTTVRLSERGRRRMATSTIIDLDDVGAVTRRQHEAPVAGVMWLRTGRVYTMPLSWLEEVPCTTSR